ncbi:MAG: TetR/AcrR family transcriptional regulator [Solobacterium sp.]|nr:TetR/AcrR family transcriptional regulator [Solobacterium sp.]
MNLQKSEMIQMTSKDLIKKQYMAEYARKDVSRISVKQLCAATPVARTTFYSYFSNTDEVLCEIEDEILAGLRTVTDSISQGNLPDMDFSVYMDVVEAYIRGHWSVIHAFLVVQPNMRFIRKWKDAVILNFKARYPGKQDAGNYDAVAEIIASTIIGAYSYWMEHPDQVSTKEIKPLMYQVLESLVDIL